MEKITNTKTRFIHHFSEIRRDDIDKVGGKGANLAALTAAGFLVPPGFCLTTQAYHEFIEKFGIEEKIAANIAGIDLDVFENIRMWGAVIREGIMATEMSEEMQEAIVKAYREGQGERELRPFVAVRSSATAEDLPDMSFAGQHDTYLNVSGEADVLFCVKKCWASLWSDRAIAYRNKNNIDHTAVLMAVVIQQMVPAAVSGILFTAHPVTNNTNELVINAAWGLGESVVSGKIAPDEYAVAKDTVIVTNKNIAEKTTMITLGDKGAVEIPVPAEQRRQVCLSDQQIQELAGIGKQIEEFFGAPQDIEWGLCENQFFILQSRPITTLHETSASIPIIWANRTVKEELKDTVVFWSNWNVRETLPYPLTPLSWSYFSDVIFPGMFKIFFQITPESPLYPYYSSGVDLVYGRLYWNMNALYGHPIWGLFFKYFLHRIDKQAGELFSALYKRGELQPLQGDRNFRAVWLGLWNMLRIASGLFAVPWLFPAEKLAKRCAQYLRESSRFEHVELQGKSDAELLRQVKEFTGYTIDFWTSSFLLMGYGAFAYEVLRFLTRKWDDVPAERLIAGIPGTKTTEGALELYKLSEIPDSLKQRFLTCPIEAIPAMLEESKAGKDFLKRLAGFLDQFGHRGPKEFDIGQPRWQDDPTFVFQMIKNYLQLDQQDTTPVEHFQQMAEERERLTERVRQRLSQGLLAKVFPVKRWFFNWMLEKAHIYLPFRENPKYYVFKCYSGSRRIFSELGSRLCKEGYCETPEDVYFLMVPELEVLFHGKDTDKERIKNLIRQRKEEWHRNLAIEPPFVVRSDGKPVSYSEEESSAANILKGDPASGGRVTGTARIILDPAEGCVFNKGEILVAPFTDPGWTPLFLTAKALVMETGGIMCHGAVVAREYGIPAVVGVKLATKRIKTGDEITVDGQQGKVILIS